MARALATDPINELEENLQCNVCLEVLTDPRTLPCCHSFCKDCLEGVVETLRGKAPRGRPIREFPCPNCRATFILDPDKHVADMPRNHFICNMVKATAVLDRGIGVPCSHNCSQSYSVARCVTCEKFLCRECLTIHNSYRGHNGHSVLTMEELSKPENRKKINDKMYCNEHAGKKLKVYCETCDQLICRDCMDFKHVKQGHSCVLVKDVANNYKELLASNAKAMEDALTEGDVFLQRLTLTTQQLDRDAENAKNKIAQRKAFVAKKVIEMLDQKAESLCKKVDEIHKGKRANLDREAEETKLYVENIKTSVQLSKKLVDQGSEEEIISSQKMMLDNANNLLTKRQEYFKAPTPVAKLCYTSSTGKEPINENAFKKLANSLGEVNDDEHTGEFHTVGFHAGGFRAGEFHAGKDTTRFDIKRTVKVSGVSQLLRDQIEKEFQAKGNSTGYDDDVNKMHVCPNGKDYVLLEFEKDIPDPKTIGDTLNIGGTALSVEQCKPPIASTEDFSSESVTKIWLPDEQILPYNDDTDANSMDRKGDRDKTGKKSHGRDARQNQINQRRPDLNSDQTPMPEDTFGETKVKLDKHFAKKIGEETKLLEILNKEHVELHKDKLKGTWNGIFAAGKMLLAYIPGFAGTGNNYDYGSSFSSQSSIDQSADAQLTPSDQSAQTKEPDESFSVSSLFLRFTIAYHYEKYQKLENVSQEISYEITESKTDRNLKLFARKDVNRGIFSKTVDEFINFYQIQNKKMHQEVVPMFPKKRNDVILEARTKFSVVIDSAQDPDKITIYGEKGNVQEALKFLKNKVGDLTTSTPSSPSEFKGGRSSKGATGSSSSKGAAAGSPNPTSTTGGKLLIEKFSCVLFQDIKVFVYQGDITKETVDVIANPADESLNHSEGAAEAIVKAGGKSIQDESDAIMRKRRFVLNPGEVVATKAGNLRCSFIIHVVGPRWSNYYQKDAAKKVLLNAVLNCLTVACHNGAKSISIPAISSGIFGVPVSICAEILFTAAITFAKNAPKSIPLKEIRFVNIDKPTSQVFAQEMKKRFGSSIHRENAELCRSNVGGGTEWADQYAQSQFNFWRENPKAATKITFEDKKTGADPSSSGVNKCAICLCDFTDKKSLHKCGHSFCATCIDEAFKHQKKCPVCSQVYGTLIGNQPQGKMFISYSSVKLPGYESCRGSISITYKFESGVQGPNHPNPGQRYSGTTRYGYLPDNKEGQKVLKLLRKAFDQKLTFTFGPSSTSGANNYVITWNDIHHKTSVTGGPTNFGYPDPKYLKRVQEELAAKGITE